MKSIGGANFYPYAFHVQFLTQWMTAIQAEKEVGVGGRLKQGVVGAVGIYRAGVSLAMGDAEGVAGTVAGVVDGKKIMDGLYSGFNALRKRISNRNEGEHREWYELYIVMNEITEEILREQDTHEELSNALEEYAHSTEEVKKHLAKGNLTPYKEAIALSYTLISLDGRLALESSHGELRRAALERLRDLIDPEKKPKGVKCLKEYGLCEVYLDLLATITCYGVEESERNSTKETLSVAIEVAENTKTSFTSKIRGLGSSDSTSARENVTRWLQNEDLDTRLASVLPPPAKQCKLGDLYGIILHRLSSKQAKSSETVDSSLEEGRKTNNSDATDKKAAKSKKDEDRKGDEKKEGEEASNNDKEVAEDQQSDGVKVEGTGKE